MNLSLQDLQAEAAATGYLPETLDKVIRLIGLLDAFRSHPFLKDRLALKGGTRSRAGPLAGIGQQEALRERALRDRLGSHSTSSNEW